MTALLRLESCTVIRPGRRLPVLCDVSLTVTAGEWLDVTGPSGSGKTTLALVIAGLLKPSKGRVVRMPSLQRRRAPIGMIFQDPFACMNPRWKVNDWLKDNCSTPAQFDVIVDLCMQLELPLDLLARYPLELSGGECQRFNLICALLVDPLLLIMDEATSMVDKQAADAMKSLIQVRRANTEMSIVNIQHNPDDSAEQRLAIEAR